MIDRLITPAATAYPVPGSPVACTATPCPGRGSIRAASATAAFNSASVYWYGVVKTPFDKRVRAPSHRSS